MLLLGNTTMSRPSDLVQGTLDLLILKILALEPLHGWAIGQRLKQVSGDILQVSDGSLYPALHKLEQEGWIEAEWKPTENNRRAKFYSLTRSGKRQLATRNRIVGPPRRRDFDRSSRCPRCDMTFDRLRQIVRLRLRSLVSGASARSRAR